MNRLENAIILATKAHRSQNYAGLPYILHPLRVMQRVEAYDEKIVAVLHDVVEDTYVTLKEIKTQFGEDIAESVDAISKRKGGETYLAYLSRVRKNPKALVVKLADMEDNLSNTSSLSLPKRLRLFAKYTRGRHFLLTGEWHDSEALDTVIKEGYKK